MLLAELKLRHGLVFALSSISRKCLTVLLDNGLKTATAIVDRSWSCQALCWIAGGLCVEFARGSKVRAVAVVLGFGCLDQVQDLLLFVVHSAATWPWVVVISPVVGHGGGLLRDVLGGCGARLG